MKKGILSFAGTAKSLRAIWAMQDSRKV